MTDNAIDFDQVLINPKGGVFTDGDASVTLGAFLYTVLTMPQADEKCTVVEAARIAKLAAVVIGSPAALTVEQKATLLRRLDASPIPAIAKAAALKIIDPAAYDQA
jgi:hypothetical protein